MHSSVPLLPTRESMIAEGLAALGRLPQASFFSEGQALSWVNEVLEKDPTGLAASLAALRGLTAADLGVLWGSQQGRFHPFSDACQVTREKLLLSAVEKPSGHRQRGVALAPVAQEKYHQKIEARGGRVRSDVLETLKTDVRTASGKSALSGFLAQHPWLNDVPPDLVEEDGKLYAVDYTCPGVHQYQEIQSSALPYYHEVQLHYYKLLLEGAGHRIEGMRLYAFSANEWEGTERSVVFQSDMSAGLLELGDRIWSSFVMAGQVAPMVTVDPAPELEGISLLMSEAPDPLSGPLSGGVRPATGFPLKEENIQQLRDHLRALGGEIFGHAVLSKEADRLREVLTRSVRDALPMRALPADVSRIDLGPVRLRAEWNFHEDRLLDAVRGALAMTGRDDAEIEALLGSDNFFHPATYAPDAVLTLLRDRKGIDVFSDADFDAARISQRQRRQDTLVAILRDLEKVLPEPLDWAELVDYETSQLKVDLARTPASGPGRVLREETEKSLREAIVPAVNRIGAQHVARLQEEKARATQEDKMPPPKSRRKGP